MLTILLADDHGLFRDSMALWLQHALEQTTIISAHDRRSLFQQLAHQPDLIMLDLTMPGMEGVMTISEIKTTYPDIPLLVVSANEDYQTILACQKMGAEGYIPKSSKGQTILKAVTQLLAGQSFFDNVPRENKSALTSFEQYQLSPRQYELLGWLAQGLSNRDIALKMNLTEGTIKQYVSQLLDVLDVDNRTQAGNKAREILGDSRI